MAHAGFVSIVCEALLSGGNCWDSKLNYFPGLAMVRQYSLMAEIQKACMLSIILSWKGVAWGLSTEQWTCIYSAEDIYGLQKYIVLGNLALTKTDRPTHSWHWWHRLTTLAALPIVSAEVWAIPRAMTSACHVKHAYQIRAWNEMWLIKRLGFR